MSAKKSATLEALVACLLSAVYFGLYIAALRHFSDRLFHAALVVGVLAFLVSAHYVFGTSQRQATAATAGSLTQFGLFAVGASIPLTLLGYPACKELEEENAPRRLSRSMQQVGAAMHAYADQHGERLPASAIYSKEGRPLLSWRVALLPYLGHDDLYRQFKLDEPWDSAHNLPLAAQMPAAYALPAIFDDRGPPNTTYFQVFVGPGAAFEGSEGVSLRDFPDGTSNTIMFTVAEEPVVWTRPADLAFHPKQPLPKLRTFLRTFDQTGYYSVELMVGSWHSVDASLTDEESRAIITRNGGEPMSKAWSQ